MPFRTRALAATLATVATFAALAAGAVSAQDAQAPETITRAFQYAVPTVPGKEVTSMVVTYAPGGKSGAHRHGKAFVVAYVLEGDIRSQLNDGPVRVYHAGESWSEAPGDHHAVSENASATKPARLIAFFIADKDDTLLTFDGKH